MKNALSIRNRNEAYADLKKEGKLSARRKQVYEAISLLVMATAQEVSKKTNLPINTVVGRINELKNSVHIQEVGRKINQSTGHQNTIYKVSEGQSGLFDNATKNNKEKKVLALIKLIDKLILYPDIPQETKMQMILKII